MRFIAESLSRTVADTDTLTAALTAAQSGATGAGE
jgi:hypothetical protein